MRPKYILCLLGIVLFLPSCAAPTGDWDEDSIGFDPRLADRRMDGIRNQLNNERQSLAAQRIRQAQLKNELDTTNRSKQNHADEIRRVKNDLARANAELSSIKAQIEQLPPESAETTRLKARVSELLKSIRRLDDLYLSLQ